MKKKTETKVTLPPISQVGIVVKDAAKTAEYYSSAFGIGPFNIQDFELRGVLFYDKPVTAKLRIAMAQMGPVQIELIQALEGGEYYTEFIRQKGEGLHHLGIQVDDFDTYDRLLADLTNQGIGVVLSRRGRRQAFAYLDTQDVGGVILELIHLEK